MGPLFLTDFDILFNDILNHCSYQPIKDKKAGYPVDVYVEDNKLFFDVAVVGIDREEIEVFVKDGSILSISYDKKEEKDKREYISRGIVHRSFKHEWKVTDKFDLSKAKVSLDKGLLRIEIPTSKNKEDRKLNIN
ncbi:MAG: Hsp20/alpha crystallin family protein [bacterium]